NPYEDTLEDCIFEIEELKNELTTIVMTSTSTGQGARNRWDTPESKDMITKKKGRLRKDRYSALLIANMIARQMAYELVPPPRFTTGGGSTRDLAQKAVSNTKPTDGKAFTTSKSEWANISLAHLG